LAFTVTGSVLPAFCGATVPSTRVAVAVGTCVAVARGVPVLVAVALALGNGTLVALAVPGLEGAGEAVVGRAVAVTVTEAVAVRWSRAERSSSVQAAAPTASARSTGSSQE